MLSPVYRSTNISVDKAGVVIGEGLGPVHALDRGTAPAWAGQKCPLLGEGGVRGGGDGDDGGLAASDSLTGGVVDDLSGGDQLDPSALGDVNRDEGRR